MQVWEKVSAMAKVRVGVIGMGYWGPNLLRNLAAIPQAEVVAVADRMEQQLRDVQEAYPQVSVTTDYHDFFESGVQAVAIATPPHTHFPIAKDCLEHGLHVMLEKPLALNSDDAQTLIDIADARQLTLMVGHTFEYNAAVRKVKEIIDGGEPLLLAGISPLHDLGGGLGRIRYIESSRLNLGIFQNSLNVMWDLAPHDISILLYLLGQEPISVSAQGHDSMFEGLHDIAHIHMVFPENVMAHIHVSWLSPVKKRQMTIIGSEKMLVYDDTAPDEKIQVYDKGVALQPGTSLDDLSCTYRYGDTTSPTVDWVEPLRAECEHFIDSILSGSTPLSDGRSGLRVVRVLERADYSLYENDEWLKGLVLDEALAQPRRSFGRHFEY